MESPDHRSESRRSWAIAGSSGWVGSRLRRLLESRGDEVLTLVRREPRSPTERRWEPGKNVPPGTLEGCRGVVNLAGESIARWPWTAARKQAIRSSRIETTETLAKAAAEAGIPVLVNASAVGFYGNRGDDILTDSSPAGGGFLADTCVAWEHAMHEAGGKLRLVRLRFGTILGTDGGALPAQLRLARFGLGGRLGSGRQWVSWISLDDAIRAIVHCLDGDLAGPVLATAPNPLRQEEYASILARERGPGFQLRVPAPILTAILGDFARELLLSSQRCQPLVLANSGFEWEHPELETLVS